MKKNRLGKTKEERVSLLWKYIGNGEIMPSHLDDLIEDTIDDTRLEVFCKLKEWAKGEDDPKIFQALMIAIEHAEINH